MPDKREKSVARKENWSEQHLQQLQQLHFAIAKTGEKKTKQKTHRAQSAFNKREGIAGWERKSKRKSTFHAKANECE